MTGYCARGNFGSQFGTRYSFLSEMHAQRMEHLRFGAYSRCANLETRPTAADCQIVKDFDVSPFANTGRKEWRRHGANSDHHARIVKELVSICRLGGFFF
jgi:hypothetical protein